MSINIRIWVEISHQAAFRAGGWAFVLAEGSALSGVAGGDRAPAAAPIALAGLIEALKGAPAGSTVEVRSASAAVLAIPRQLADAGGAPDSDLDLWTQLAAAMKGRAVRFAQTSVQPRTPAAFAAAWAELARDKAKTRPFHAAIPKVNLAKAGVPA